MGNWNGTERVVQWIKFQMGNNDDDDNNAIFMMGIHNNQPHEGT